MIFRVYLSYAYAALLLKGIIFLFENYKKLYI